MSDTPLSPVLLRAALAGLEAKKKRLQEQIDGIRGLLELCESGAFQPQDNRRESEVAVTVGGERPHISPEGRQRISAAHIKRWAVLKASRADADAAGEPSEPDGAREEADDV